MPKAQRLGLLPESVVGKAAIFAAAMPGLVPSSFDTAQIAPESVKF